MNKLNKKEILSNIDRTRVNIDIFDQIDSTNEESKRIKINSDIHIIIAEEQIKGKGRLGKKWSSPNLGNIYLTIATLKELNDTPLSLITGILCIEALKNFVTDGSLGLKWPNDLVFANKKVGGILIEREIKGDKNLSIIGIGINFDLQEKESWWGDLSKYELKSKRSKIINNIILNFIDFVDNGIYDWQSKWEDMCIHMNKEIKILRNNEITDTAIFKGINKEGKIKIFKNDEEKIIEFGEISIKGIYK